MHGNYDAVAGYYDRLARLVFGDAIKQAHLFLLKAIPAGTSILIVGGGTGWILEEIANIHPQGLQITYVELSEKMMDRARKRAAGENRVTFICGAVQKASLEGYYDVVITPFLFDNFSEATLQLVFHKLDQHLKHGGLWLYTDFQQQKNRIYTRLLLRLMYLFFGFLCKLETSNVPDAAAQFQHHNYRIIREKKLMKGFIRSVVYEKRQL